MRERTGGIVGFLLALFVVVVGVFASAPGTVAAGQDNGWKVWVKVSPCSGFNDWVSVAKENPAFGGGGGSYFNADHVLSGGDLQCVYASSDCTFAAAEAEKAIVMASGQFENYCCRDYSVWRQTQTGAFSIVQGAGNNAGFGWELEQSDLCCFEAEELAGLPGVCSGTSAGTVRLLGCFRDPNNPFDLDGFLERSQSNTPQRCVETCRAKGFAYAGVQYGQSCLCGNSFGKFGPADSCNMRCTGDSSQMCGGMNANSVYSTGLGSR